MRFKWYAVTPGYITFLKRSDSLVQNIEYGANRFKPYIGIVHEIAGYNYFVPVSSFKPKFVTMKENIDFIKIPHPTRPDYIFGALNLNNMIPVPDACLTRVSLDNIDHFRIFSTDADKMKYMFLLNDELNAVNDRAAVILANTEKLYNLCKANPNSRIAQRCCKFSLLEQQYIIYCQQHKYEYPSVIQSTTILAPTGAVRLDQRQEIAIDGQVPTPATKHVAPPSMDKPSISDRLAVAKTKISNQQVMPAKIIPHKNFPEK